MNRTQLQIWVELYKAALTGAASQQNENPGWAATYAARVADEALKEYESREVSQNTSLVTGVERLVDDETVRNLCRTLHLDDEGPDDDDEPLRDHGR